MVRTGECHHHGADIGILGDYPEDDRYHLLEIADGLYGSHDTGAGSSDVPLCAVYQMDNTHIQAR